MNNKLIILIPICLLYVLLTVIITFPLLKTIATGLPVSNEGLGPQDAWLTSWTLSWDLHKFNTELKGFFNANIFFPNQNTLAYSEHMIGVAVMALPLTLFIENPILIYNIVLFGSFVLSGVGMYLLAFHLTRDIFASIIAGIIFAFFPYHYIHLSRLQLGIMQWIPITFLFLHRFTEQPNYKNIIFAALFFSLEFLSCLYYGVYLTFFAMLLISWSLIIKKGFFVPSLFVKLGVFTAIIALVIVPLHLPYVHLRDSMGFSRAIEENIPYSADIVSYMAAPKSNRFWGPISMERPWNEGATFFLGVVPVVLAIIGLLLRKNRATLNVRIFYSVVVVLAFLLSLGPVIHFNGKEILKGPYILLYKFFPGFSGLRAPNRIAIFCAFGISILAAFGIKGIIDKIKGTALKIIIVSILGGIIIIEYFPANLNALVMGSYRNIPAVYKWLSQKKEEFSIIEYPLLEPQPEEALYMYYSIFHWKKLVNGYSGYTPPIYNQLKGKMKLFPSTDAVLLLKDIGVKYVIVHTKGFPPDETHRIRDGLYLLPDIKLRKQFGNVLVYEIVRGS